MERLGTDTQFPYILRDHRGDPYQGDDRITIGHKEHWQEIPTTVSRVELETNWDDRICESLPVKEVEFFLQGRTVAHGQWVYVYQRRSPFHS